MSEQPVSPGTAERRLRGLLLLGLAVFALSVLAVDLRPPRAPVALWWPAAAVAAAAALRLPAGRWRAAAGLSVVMSSAAANVAGGRPALTAVLFGVSNGAEALVVAHLYGHRSGVRRELDGLPVLGRLLAASGAGALVIAAGAGATVALLLDGSLLGTARSVLVTHGSALVMFLPLLLLPREHRLLGRRTTLELLLLVALQAVTVAFVFGPGQDLPLTALVLVWVVLAALRLPPRTAHVVALASVGSCAVMTVLGNGPFAAAGTNAPLVAVNLVQVFAVVVIGVELTVALTGVERRRALQDQVELRRRLAVQVAFVEGLMDNLDEAVLACDAQGRVTYLNHVASRLGPDGRRPVVGMRLQDWPVHDGFRAADGRPVTVADLPLLRALHDDLHGPVLMTQVLDGQVRHLRGSGRRIVAADGTLLGAVTSAVDLTRELTLQEELRRARERAEALWTAAPVGITEAAADGNTLSANARFCSMLGYAPGELVGRPAHSLVAPDQADAVRDGIAALRDGHGYTAERAYLHRQGHRVPVQVSTVALRDADGRIDRLAAFFVDLSDVHAQRDALAEAQRVGRLGSFRLDPLTWQPLPTLELCRVWGHTSVQPADRLRAQLLEEDGPRVAEALQQLLRTGGRTTLTFRIRRADSGDVRTLRSSVEVELDEHGRPASGSGTHQDVTELVQAEQQARQAQQYVEAVLAANPDLIFVTDLRTGSVEYGSPGKTVLGMRGEDFIALGADGRADVVHPDDVARLSAGDSTAGDLQDGQVVQARVRARHTDGSWRWLSRRTTPFRRDADGAVTHVVSTVRDVTDTVEAEERLRHTALHDVLTGLPNRALLHDRAVEALHRAAEQQHDLAVLYVDLDGFKRVNDTAGHAAGDEVLRATAERLRGAVRPQDTVARLGGDEFVVLVEATRRHPGEPAPSVELLARSLADRILDAVGKSVLHDGTVHRVGASIGIRCVTADAAAGLDVTDVLQDADTAMFDVKGHGKHGYALFADPVVPRSG